MKKILIVEDSKVLCSLLKARLEHEGFSVDLIYSGLAMLSYMKENEEPDAIILDLFIPEISGIELFDSIVNKWKRTAIFIYSAHTKWKTMLANQPSVRAFFSKSDDMKDLVAAIKEELA